MNIRVIVAAHKPYRMPADPMYLPLHVGHAGKPDLGYTGDDTGDQISQKNAHYCELTGLYWAWKNLNADYIGLVHYRRHFTVQKAQDKFAVILTGAQAEEILCDVPVIVPNKRHYYIETIYSHYIHSHRAEGIDTMLRVLRTQYPDYAPACDRVMNRRWAHMFNMFIMRRDVLDGYCNWLFSILSEVEKQVDISQYDTVEGRIFGYLSEPMLDIYLEKNQIAYREVPVQFMEKQNWLKKGGLFLKRKLTRHENTK